MEKADLLSASIGQRKLWKSSRVICSSPSSSLSVPNQKDKSCRAKKQKGGMTKNY